MRHLDWYLTVIIIITTSRCGGSNVACLKVLGFEFWGKHLAFRVYPEADSVLRLWSTVDALIDANSVVNSTIRNIRVYNPVGIATNNDKLILLGKAAISESRVLIWFLASELDVANNVNRVGLLYLDGCVDLTTPLSHETLRSSIFVARLWSGSSGCWLSTCLRSKLTQVRFVYDGYSPSTTPPIGDFLIKCFTIHHLETSRILHPHVSHSISSSRKPKENFKRCINPPYGIEFDVIYTTIENDLARVSSELQRRQHRR